MKDLKAINLKLNSDQPVPHRNQFVPFHVAWGKTDLQRSRGIKLLETSNVKGVLYPPVVRNRFSLHTWA